MNRSKRFRPLVAAGLLLAVSLLAGCDRPSAAAPAAAPPPPPEVGVVTVAPQRVPLTTELPGRIQPLLIAEVRPQVGGLIEERLFEEGAEVRAGQALYRIDPASHRAAHASAAADLARAEARLTPARLKAERYRELARIDGISRQELDDAEAAFRLAEAEVAAARAALQTARIRLDDTTVKAPITGRIGRSLMTTGALVTANQASPLATIQQLDPVYVDVTRSSAELLRLRQALADGSLSGRAPGEAQVELLLEDGSRYDQPGVLKFSDVTVNQSTGSVTLRTVFPNPEQLLLPGMYVRAVLEEGVVEQAILVPQQGVTRDPAGNASALVVNGENLVEKRTLQLARAIGNQWLVSAGLAAGDRLIVEGTQKARPGSPVRPVVVTVTEPSPQVTRIP